MYVLILPQAIATHIDILQKGSGSLLYIFAKN